MAISEPVKLIMTWDIAPTKEREYFEFVVRVVHPRSAKHGSGDQRSLGDIIRESPANSGWGQDAGSCRLQQMLNSKEWNDLHEQILEYIVNYDQKVARYSVPVFNSK